MKKTLVYFSLVAALITTSISVFALPPSGGGTECPDRCKTDDNICCATPGGSHYMGSLKQQ